MALGVVSGDPVSSLDRITLFLRFRVSLLPRDISPPPPPRLSFLFGSDTLALDATLQFQPLHYYSDSGDSGNSR